MLAECLALVAAICLDESARVEVISDAFWVGARIEVDGAEITSVIRTDAGLFPDRRRIPRYCAASTCIYYHAYCAQEGERYFCRISYFYGRNLIDRALEIYAQDQSTMTGLLGRLRLAVPGATRLLPLSVFRERSATPSTPWCRPREDRGCR